MSKAVPIPIQKRTSSKSGSSSRGGGGGVSASVPIAPVIGSLPPPSQLSLDMPDLSLPASTPEALSLAEVATAETTQRLVGVSSAPALSYIEQARRKGYPGTSPTVLSILQIKGGIPGDLNNLMKQPFSSFSPSMVPLSSMTINNNNTGGLSAMLKGRNNNDPSLQSLNASLNNLHIQSNTATQHYTTNTSVLSTVGGGGGNPSSLPKHTGMILATSFRDPAHMPPPLPEDLEGEEDEASSDDDAVMVARRRAIANHTYYTNNTNGSSSATITTGVVSATTIHNRTNRVKEEDEEDDDDDDHHMNPQQGRQHAANDDEVFESDL